MAIGRHYQNAYVTRNVDKAVASFRAHADTRLVIQTEVDKWAKLVKEAGIKPE